MKNSSRTSDYFLDNVIDDAMSHVNTIERTDALTSKQSTAKIERIPFVLTFHPTNKTMAIPLNS